MWQRLRSILVRPTAVYLAATVVARVGALALVPFYTRVMTVEQYGEYALALTIMSLGPAFALGLPTATTKAFFEIKDPAEATRRYGAIAKLIVALLTALAVIAMVGIALFADDSPGLTGRHALVCIVIATWGTTILAVPTQFSRDTQRPFLAAGLQGAEFVLSLGLGIGLAVGLGRGLRGALEALAACYAALGVYGVVFIHRSLRGAPSTAIARAALGFSLPYVPHFLAVWLQAVVERWVLRFAGRLDELGPYALAVQLTSPLNLLVASWNQERSAQTGQVFRDEGLEGMVRRLGAVTRSYLLVAAIPAILLVLCLPAAALLLGDRFGSVVWYAPFLVAAIVVDAAYNPANHVAYFIGRSRLIALSTVAAAGVATAVSVALVPTFGIRGAIATRILAAAVRTGVMWWAVRSSIRSVSRPEGGASPP